MPRYIVQRTFANGIQSPFAGERAGARLDVVEQNAELGVTWIHSYVSEDQRTSYCVYDAPDEASVLAHGAELGMHNIQSIDEIAGDVTPADFPDA